jgi:hypothetical protein
MGAGRQAVLWQSAMQLTTTPGGTTGGVRLMLRLEGTMVLLASLALYHRLSGAWATFAICFLLPDVSFAGYLFGPKIGALTYNAAHSYVGPLLCACAAATTGSQGYELAMLIWTAHIGFDRALGYGLKYVQGFGFTHLGPIGRHATPALNLPTRAGVAPDSPGASIGCDHSTRQPQERPSEG